MRVGSTLTLLLALRDAGNRPTYWLLLGTALDRG
jgi:hypothetical protein